MRKCPLTYFAVEDRYDLVALRRLHPQLRDLKDLPYNSDELRWEAAGRAHKLSIQGVQPKLSARLNVKEQTFELVDEKGRFILKPQNSSYPALPENEDLTMKLARQSGLEVPDHGLIYDRDGVVTYWIRRFDRRGRGDRVPVEDFAQLLGRTRETKYESSLEEVASAIREHCSFPLAEYAKLFRLVVFNFLSGNEDQHLKNFSIIEDGVCRLSPCYDLLNSTIATKSLEETALPLRGKNRNINREDVLDYFGRQVLQLQPALMESILRELASSLVRWPAWIERSFLWPRFKREYEELTRSRSARLGFHWLEVTAVEREVLEKAVLSTGTGGHPGFFKQLEAQRQQCAYVLTDQQVRVIHDRQAGTGGWQTAYNILASKCASG